METVAFATCSDGNDSSDYMETKEMFPSLHFVRDCNDSSDYLETGL